MPTTVSSSRHAICTQLVDVRVHERPNLLRREDISRLVLGPGDAGVDENEGEAAAGQTCGERVDAFRPGPHAELAQLVDLSQKILAPRPSSLALKQPFFSASASLSVQSVRRCA